MVFVFEKFATVSHIVSIAKAKGFALMPSEFKGAQRLKDTTFCFCLLRQWVLQFAGVICHDGGDGVAALS